MCLASCCFFFLLFNFPSTLYLTKYIKNVAEFSVQQHTNELPQQNCLFIILVESASWSALQAP